MKVFISYRREDSAGHTGRLYDSLRDRIGDENLFLDLSGIDSGQNFVDTIQAAIQSCDLLLAIIGCEWLTCSANGRRRLDEPNDLVRSEIRTALERRTPVIPVLVGGATAPAAAALPAPLKPLATLDAHELTDERWAYDVDRLIGAMHRITAPKNAKRRRRWMVAATVGILALAAVAMAGGFAWRQFAEPAAAGRDGAAQIGGEWAASVTYDWGASYTERFVFEVDGGHVTGTASFLGVPRGIVDGQFDDDRLVFRTRTQEIAGSESRDVVQRYQGRVAGETIAFTMQREGASSTVPVTFMARRPRTP